MMKRSEVLIHATTWINLENIMLSERNQPQRTIRCMIPLYAVSRTGKFKETESRLNVARDWGRRE